MVEQLRDVAILVAIALLIVLTMMALRWTNPRRHQGPDGR